MEACGRRWERCAGVAGRPRVWGDPEVCEDARGCRMPARVWGPPEGWADASGAEEQGRAAAAPQPKRYTGLSEHS